MDFKNKSGALWLKTSKSGKMFMSGVIKVNEEDIPILVFKNNKGQEKHPDYNIYIADDKKEEKEEEAINMDDIPM
jgi:hypothetical protein